MPIDSEDNETSHLFWHLDPKVSVGPIRFGEPAGPVIKKYGLIKCVEEPMIECEDWDTYEFTDCETRVYVENDKIENIGCYDELFYKGKNLFGMTLDELRKHLGPETEIGETFDLDSGDECTPIQWDNLEIQVWLDKDGLVDSVMCNGLIEEDEEQ